MFHQPSGMKYERISHFAGDSYPLPTIRVDDYLPHVLKSGVRQNRHVFVLVDMVLTFLKEKRPEAVDRFLILQKLGISAEEFDNLNLEDNEKVIFEGGKYAWRAPYPHVRNSRDILKLLIESEKPIAEEDIRQSYKEAADDILQMIDDHEIRRTPRGGTSSHSYLYPYHPELGMAVDGSLIEWWATVPPPLPSYEELEYQVTGQRALVEDAEVEPEAKKPRKNASSARNKRAKITNKHLQNA